MIKDRHGNRYAEFERKWTEITGQLFNRLNITPAERVMTLEFEGGEREFFKVDGVYVQKLSQYTGGNWIVQYYISDINW